MDIINEGLMNFINRTPNEYSCVENIKKVLFSHGFRELHEEEDWAIIKKSGDFFVTKGDSSIIAFEINGTVEGMGFNMTASHTDSPCFAIKSNPEIFENGYLKLNISGYGGTINYSWFDRPLSIAGRVIYLKDGAFNKAIINIEKDLLVIPSQAIHINREVNEKNTINIQNDMLPIMSLTNESFASLIEQEFIEENISYDSICDYDLFLYNRDQARICGNNGDFILAPRLDDLACVYLSLMAFVDSNHTNAINVFCALNNEEIGSMKQQGAGSPFVLDTLAAIARQCELDLLIALSNSFMISADNAHAVHPNAASKSDLTNKAFINKGVVLKHHVNYTTDALSSSIFKELCKEAGIPCQDYASRSDMRAGSTLGGISASLLGIDSVDIGLSQLAMHSSNELIGSKDTSDLYQVLLKFYEMTFRREKGAVSLQKK